MSKQTKSVLIDEVELKDASDKFPGGLMSGYAAVKNVVDSQMDVILDGAFKKTIRENPSVPVLDSHAFHRGAAGVIGKTISMEEDRRGLKFTAFFSETPDAQAVRQKMREGIITKMSFGFRIVKDRMRRDGVRELLELAVMEISPVVFPANAATSVSVTKQQWDEMDASDRAAHLVRACWLPELEQALIDTKTKVGKMRGDRVSAEKTLQALKGLSRTIDGIDRVWQRLRWDAPPAPAPRKQEAERVHRNEFGTHRVKARPVQPPLRNNRIEEF